MWSPATEIRIPFKDVHTALETSKGLFWGMIALQLHISAKPWTDRSNPVPPKSKKNHIKHSKPAGDTVSVDLEVAGFLQDPHLHGAWGTSIYPSAQPEPIASAVKTPFSSSWRDSLKNPKP